ncbi:cephalosporin hydroxylase family protein [Aestuariibacter sp. AA17]|uniref:Cephalosporin hydroxylase family protein n=1 Tax=Fluctibacter corallii TaxID=2984329 RepID=A0ABT3A9T1_9ALTE|nr:cephalosporin hydroxylase family protein [Aestuariibacter sp. AA17]MCV2885428.1 cephalosporin hydroxylase family protein [Aestuariibacter sp. AA17]
MKIKSLNIDFESDSVTAVTDDKTMTVGIGTEEGFKLISKAMLRTGWDNKYVYSFSWLGRPIIQLPDDMIRIQELIYQIKPDVIIETGVAHGGSLVFYASIMKAIGKGKVIGVDVEIRPHNRHAIESHELFEMITLIEGDSIADATISSVKQQIESDQTVLIFLDAKHTKDHVLAELDAYSPLVSKNSYIVAMDGIMKDVVGAPRASDDWSWNNPYEAAKEFCSLHDEFTLEEPEFPFNEGTINQRYLTYWPGAFIKRLNG